MPKSRLGRLVRSPFMKFFYYSVSFATFLGLLTWATFEDYRYEKGERVSFKKFGTFLKLKLLTQKNSI